MRIATPREAAILRGFAARVDAADADALNNLGVLFAQRGLMPEAAEALISARRLDPSLVVAQRNLEVVLAQGGALATRGDRLRDDAFAHPERREAWLALARWHAAVGHEVEALEAADSLLALDPADPTATALAIEVLLEAGRPDDAALRASDAIRREPTVGRWRRLLADARYHAGRYAEALAATQEALQCDPDDADALLLQAFVLGDLGRVDEARRVYRSAVLLRPAIGRGEANRSLDEYDPRRFEALAPGRQAQRRSGRLLVPDEATPAAHTIGLAARALGHGSAATAAFQQVLATEASPSSGEALAELALDAGDAATAFARYDALCATAADRAEWWTGRGVALHQLGRLGEAEASYRRALACKADALPASNNLAVVLAQRGQAREALVMLLTAVEAAPALSALRVNLARALALGSEPALSLAQYERVLQSDPEEADAWYGAGTVLQRLGRLEDALHAYARAVQVRPGFTAAATALTSVRARLGEPGDVASSSGHLPPPPAFRLLVARGTACVTLSTRAEPADRAPVPAFQLDSAALDALFRALRRPSDRGAA